MVSNFRKSSRRGVRLLVNFSRPAIRRHVRPDGGKPASARRYCGRGPSPIRGPVWIAAIAIPLMLLAPALWNGYPLLQWDTGGYLARWYEGYLVPSRSTVFGLYLHFGEDFELLDQPRDPGAGDAVDPAVDAARARHGAAVAAAGDQPRAGPDHLAALACQHAADRHLRRPVRAVAFHPGRCMASGPRSPEKCLLFAFTAFAAATHSATLAVLLGLCCVGWIARPFLRGRISVSGLAQGSLTIVAGAAMLLAANFALSGTTGMDARRLRRRVRTDDAGWHRRAVSARSLSAAELQALPLSRSASRHRRPVPVGQQHVQHARPLSGNERRDGLHRAAFAGRISGLAGQGGADGDRAATGPGRAPAKAPMSGSAIPTASSSAIFPRS